MPSQTLSIYVPEPPNWGPLLYIVELPPSAPAPPLPPMVARGYAFDERFAAWFFGATNEWKDTTVPLSTLAETMPPNTVSPNAKRVAVWKPIIRALERPRGTVKDADGVTYAKLLPLSPTAGASEYLVALDFRNRMFACSCAAYTGEGHEQKHLDTWKKRHALCKHLMLLIFERMERVLEFSPLSEGERASWRASKAKIASVPRDQYTKDILVANLLYYFIRHVFARMGMRPSDYRG
ncbi:MAG: hypothetical protein QXG08_01005 [Candidatus Methanomethyliaceae archaeon]